MTNQAQTLSEQRRDAPNYPNTGSNTRFAAFNRAIITGWPCNVQGT